MDITSASQPWIKTHRRRGRQGWQVDGKQYGVPYSFGIVGFWYSKDLFAKAGITAPPTTMDELNADIAKLKAAGITPDRRRRQGQVAGRVLVGLLRGRADCTQDDDAATASTYKFDDPCFVKAGEDLKSSSTPSRSSDGFLGTPAQQGAGSSAGLVANGKAAMELQGHWDAGVMAAADADDKELGSKLGWFPFPAVAGGEGSPTPRSAAATASPAPSKAPAGSASTS